MKRFNDSKITLLLLVFVMLMLTATSANANFVFGEPEKVSGLRWNEFINCLSYDGLEMYTEGPGGPNGDQSAFDIWVRKRASKDEDWGPPENLGALINSFELTDHGACISSDALTLYFVAEGRPDGYGGSDIYATTRANKNDPWGPAVNLGPTINSSSSNRMVWVSADNLELYFGSNMPGGYGASDIYVARRATANDPWGTPVNLGPVVNTPYGECHVGLSPDGLLLLFSEWYTTTNIRPGGYGAPDIWMTRRASKDAPWQKPVNLGPPINGPIREFCPWISPDGHTLHFDLINLDVTDGAHFQAPIIAIVDFNGDGIVDAADMCIMIDHWGEDYPLCDIGPFAWGDGIVDVEDLVALAEHLFEQVDDPTLIAHWGLDETEGMVVTDSAGDNDGYALGEPIWQPNSGQVKGALQLDGVDDYVVTGMAPSPEKESYSVLAWIKGGAPGQVVLSQMGKANWLYTDPSTGALMTELKGSDPDGCTLVSETIITDSNWHRIGFVWDSSYRRLYVDSVIVAEDTQDNLDISINGLYFGAGKGMETGSFWSGLIDDVRIYNRTIRP